MEAIAVWATSLSADFLKIGGSAALLLGGMIMGTQSHPQVMFTPILGPALIANGVDPVNIAVASSHLAAAGQGMPPADLNTFFVAAFIGSLIGKKVDPMKSMFYTLAYCIPFALMGFVFLYI